MRPYTYQFTVMWIYDRWVVHEHVSTGRSASVMQTRFRWLAVRRAHREARSALSRQGPNLRLRVSIFTKEGIMYAERHYAKDPREGAL